MKFRTILWQAGKTATGIRIPSEIIESFGAGKNPPVRVTIKGYTYRSTVATVDGHYMVGVSAENRKGADVAGGDEVEVDLELDTEPRTVEVPDVLMSALSEKHGALEAFNALATSRRKEFVRQVNEAKSQETQDRRIAKIVAELGNS